MKKILSIICLSFLLSGNVFAYNFKVTINEYSLSNKGVVSSIYILNRCSGVLVYLSSMLLKEPDQKKAALKYIDYSTVATHNASKLYSKHHNVSYEKANDVLFNRMVKLENFYREDAKELFLRNGSYLSGHVWEDLDTCITILDSIINR